MAEFIRIPVPAEYDEDPDDFDLNEYVEGFIHDDGSGMLGAALDFGADLADDSRITLSAIQVEDVAVMGDLISVECSVEYSAYYGCDDMDGAFEGEATATGRREGAEWVFPVYVRPIRYPNEEL